MNWYAYCNNNPLAYIDPSGLTYEDGGAKYDRDAAVKYAKKYAFGWNRDYMKMDNWAFKLHYFMLYGKQAGNDCANFVSQCLEAGGIEQNDDWYYYRHYNSRVITELPYETGLYEDKDGKMTHRWCDYYFTAVWTMAKAQYEYFSNPENGYIDSEEIIISSAEELLFAIENYNIQKGDLLYFENEKGIHHATIISSVTDDDILYTAHTLSRLDAKLSKKIRHETAHIIRLKDFY